jgi:hypothetical protein
MVSLDVAAAHLNLEINQTISELSVAHHNFGVTSNGEQSNMPYVQWIPM